MRTMLRPSNQCPFILLMVLMAFPAIVQAEHQRGDRTLGEGFLYGGYITGLSEKHFSSSESAMGGMALTLYVTPRIGIEGDLMFPAREWGPNRFSGSVSPILLMGQLVYLPLRDALDAGHVVPYVSAGGGGSITGGISSGFTVGGGLKYWGSSGVGLRLDAKAYFTEAKALGTDSLGTEPRVPAENMTLFLISLGVTFQPRY